MSGLSTSGNIQSSSVKSSASGRETSLQTPPSYQNMQPVASRHVSLRDMVLTPARVPPFIIPTLSAARRSGRCSAGGSSRRHTLPGSAHSPRPNRAPSRCCCPLSALDVSGMESRACALSDPWTRAAMSLPHLAKITTPYGFLTLGESPCVRRRESLFFQEHQPQPGPSHGQQGVKPRRESSLRSQDPTARCCTDLQPENDLKASCDCSKTYKCTHLPSVSQRTEEVLLIRTLHEKQKSSKNLNELVT